MSEPLDVVILGGGLAGLTCALQLRQSLPGVRVRVLERARLPFPAAAHKVGESTVEIGAHYFSEVLGLRPHLEQHHLRKFGFRFFHCDRLEGIDDVLEIGVSRYLSTPSYQIDRGILENFLVGHVRDAGAEVITGAEVTGTSIGEQSATAGPHRVAYRVDGVVHEVEARWVVDASGRKGLLKRKLGLAERNGHDANAVWFRVPARLDIESWSQDEGWLQRCMPGQRWRSTNHLVGDGYWVWMIPLSSGFHSIGIVADQAKHPFARLNSYARALEWLETHQPRLARAVREAGTAPADFMGLRRYSYGCRELYSPDRWAITGEAGMFLDPFYSPGSDFIAIGNTYITDLVGRDLRGEPFVPFLRLHSQMIRSFYDSMLTLYEGQYALFGDPEVLPAKVIWDYTYYWGVLCQLFFQERLADLQSISRVRDSLLETRALNDAVQAFMRAWSAVSEKRNPARLLDQAQLPWFAEMNRGLRDRLDDAAFVARLHESAERLRDLAAEMVGCALASHPAVAGWPEAQRVLALAGREPQPERLLRYPPAAA